MRGWYLVFIRDNIVVVVGWPRHHCKRWKMPFFFALARMCILFSLAAKASQSLYVFFPLFSLNSVYTHTVLCAHAQNPQRIQTFHIVYMTIRTECVRLNSFALHFSGA